MIPVRETGRQTDRARPGKRRQFSYCAISKEKDQTEENEERLLASIIRSLLHLRPSIAARAYAHCFRGILFFKILFQN